MIKLYSKIFERGFSKKIEEFNNLKNNYKDVA